MHFETLYPFSFIEFLQALGQKRLCDYLTSLTLDDSIAEPIHDKLLHYLKIYFITGGMPEAVELYRKGKNFSAVREVHRNIIRAYILADLPGENF